MNKYGAEKLPFTQIDQVGVVVRDMDKAVEYYSSLGIGPFESMWDKVTLIERKIMGKLVSLDDIKTIVMVAQMGHVQLELIQPITGKFIHQEFLESHGEGIDHLGIYVDDIDKEVAKMVKKGFKVTFSGKFREGGSFAYLDTDKVGGVVFELIQPSPENPDKTK